MALPGVWCYRTGWLALPGVWCYRTGWLALPGVWSGVTGLGGWPCQVSGLVLQDWVDGPARCLVCVIGLGGWPCQVSGLRYRTGWMALPGVWRYKAGGRAGWPLSVHCQQVR